MTEPQPAVTTVWGIRLTGPGGDQYQTMADQGFAEFTADAAATRLAEVAAGLDRLRGPEVTAVAVVCRERRVYPDGAESQSAWRYVRHGIAEVSS